MLLGAIQFKARHIILPFPTDCTVQLRQENEALRPSQVAFIGYRDGQSDAGHGLDLAAGQPDGAHPKDERGPPSVLVGAC